MLRQNCENLSNLDIFYLIPFSVMQLAILILKNGKRRNSELKFEPSASEPSISPKSSRTRRMGNRKILIPL